METLNIKIPKADFLFSDVAKRKADKIIKADLDLGTFISPYIGVFERIISDIEKDFYGLKFNGDKIIFINEFLIHIFNLKIDYNKNIDILIIQQSGTKESYDEQRAETNNSIDDLQYHLYGLLSDCGYNLDTEIFTDTEAIEFDEKIDQIIVEVDNLRMGQSIIGDLLEDLQIQLNSIKNGKPLGKTISVQRLKGLAVDYIFNKLTDKGVEKLQRLLLTLIYINKKEIYQPIFELLTGKK